MGAVWPSQRGVVLHFFCVLFNTSKLGVNDSGKGDKHDTNRHMGDRTASCSSLRISGPMLENITWSQLELNENETDSRLELIENELELNEDSLRTSVSARIN